MSLLLSVRRISTQAQSRRHVGAPKQAHIVMQGCGSLASGLSLCRTELPFELEVLTIGDAVRGVRAGVREGI